jgi:hypothetical protein
MLFFISTYLISFITSFILCKLSNKEVKINFYLKILFFVFCLTLFVIVSIIIILRITDFFPFLIVCPSITITNLILYKLFNRELKINVYLKISFFIMLSIIFSILTIFLFLPFIGVFWGKIIF